MKKLLILLLVCNTCWANLDTLDPEVEKIVSGNEPTIIADKTNGTITVYYPMTKQSITQPALFGKVKSNVLDLSVYDTERRTNYITPSGTFPLKKIYSWRLNADLLAFIDGKKALGAIHPLWKGNPDQKRIERLHSKTPDDNRITGGCINVDEDFFYSTLNTLPEGTTLIILPE